MFRKQIFWLVLLSLICPPGLYSYTPQSKARTKRAKVDETNVPLGRPLAFYLMKGGRFLETGDYTLAISYLNAALKAPRKGTKPAVIKVLETLYKTALIYQEAKQLKDSGHSEEAVAKYQEIIKLNPTDPRPLEFILEIYDLLSEAAEKHNDYPEAMRLYEAWSSFAPQNSFPRQQMLKNLHLAAEQADKQHEVDKAIGFYRRLINLDPDDKRSNERIQAMEKEQIIGKALADSKQADIGQAIIALNSALSLYPNEPNLREALRLAKGKKELTQAEALMANYNYHEALRFYQQAIEFLPEEKNNIASHIAEIRLRTGTNYLSDGNLSLSGTINGPARIKIVGNQVTYLSGKENISLNLTSGAFPARLFEAKIVREQGDIGVTIVEPPQSSNKYSLVLDLAPKKEKAFNFNIDWELAFAGTVTWKAKITGRTILRLQGMFIDQTKNAQVIAITADPLPHEDYLLTINKLPANNGLTTNIIERPTSANDYATAIEIIPTQSLPEEIVLRVDWNLTRTKKAK